MAQRPFFSIITATKNAEAQIGVLGRSLAAQKCGDFEWVLQDGGSTDRTLRVAREAVLDARLRIRSEPDTGIYSAFNKAIDRAVGEYFLFLGSDDRLYDDSTLAEIGHELRTHADTPLALLGRCEYEPSGRVFESSLGLKSYAMNSVHNQAAAYRSDIFKTFRFPQEYPVVADYALTLRLLADKEEVRTAPGITFAVCGEGGVSQTSSEITAYRDMLAMRRGHVPGVFSYSAFALAVLNVGRRRIFR